VATWRRGELPRRYFDPFIWSQKTRLILLGVLVLVVAVVVVSMVTTADVRASLTDVTVASGQITYTADTEVHRGRPVDLHCEVTFELTDDMTTVTTTDDWTLHAVDGAVSTPHLYRFQPGEPHQLADFPTIHCSVETV
jgi:hypothetical protein